LNLRIPAEFANPRDGAGKVGVRQHRAQFLAKTEARAAHARIMQLAEIGIVGFREHQRVGAAAVIRAHGGERIEHHRMIRTIGRGLHDDAAFDAERLVNAQCRFPGRRRHLVSRARAHRIFVDRPHHVELAVDAFRRRQP
jgi:hypothetical protein